LAINIPTELKEKIAKTFLSKLNIKGLKPVQKENLHLTMKFLGNLPEDALEDFADNLLALAKKKKFEIELQGIGDFKKRVIWIGVTKGSKELAEIGSRINSLLELHGKKFSAHLTLARNKFLEHEKANALLNELKKIGFKEKFLAESLDIMESQMTPSGPKYSVLKKIQFT